MGMLPAQLRFETRQLFGRQIYDRLIKHLEVVFLDCAGEVGFDLSIGIAIATHCRFEDLDTIRAGLLGAVHRQLGVFQKIALSALGAIP